MSVGFDVDAACRGEREAVAALARAYAPRVFGLAFRLLSARRDLAEEATQETFVRILRALPTLRDRERLTSWILTIAANTARELGRKARREAPLEVEPSVLPAPIDDDGEQAARQRALARAVDALEPEDRELFLLHKIEGLHLRELAEQRRTSLPAMKSRLHRLQARVRVAAYSHLSRGPRGRTP